MDVVVTGAAGFIGSNLTDALLVAGHDVLAIDDLSSGPAGDVASDARFRQADVADLDAMTEAFAGREVVFHQAAHRSVARSVDQPLASDHANTHGTLSVLAAARAAGVRRVVYASSSSVYGTAEVRPTPEIVAPRPGSPYAVSKLAGEHYARVYSDLYGLETVSLRYFNVYGPRQRPDSAYAPVIPRFIDLLRRGEAPTVHGDGRQTRDFTYVGDVVRANELAAVAPEACCSGRVLNVAGGTEVSLLDILDALGSHLDVEIDPTHPAARRGDVRHTCADLAAARAAIGFEPAVSLADGLARTVDWLAARRAEAGTV